MLKQGSVWPVSTLPQNSTPNPESLLRKVWPHVIRPQISLSATEPVTPHHLLFTPSPRKCFAITLLCLLPRSLLGLRLTLEGRILRSRRVSFWWCRSALSVARPTRMLVLIFSNSWSSAALLLSREFLKTWSLTVTVLSGGERSSGFMLTRV
jgi:hypothetical protein